MSEKTTVYGPVKSWRFGRSLGIDPILDISTCSFNCVYCQLGEIQHVTMEQRHYVATDRIVAELEQVDWDGVDVVTLSGSGEPTLALNIDEIIDAIHRIGNKPVMVLTNSTWLGDGATQARLMKADTVACKLDASNDATLQKVNRPADGVTLSSIVDGIKSFRAVYTGKLALQCMLMPMNRSIVHELSELIREIQPDEVHLNTPRRPKPRSWYLGARGNHVGDSPVATVMLKTITLEEARDIEHELRAAIPTVPILSIYQDAPKD